jgi:MFS transporter, DHA1 family, multidrug resistance protein
VWAERYGRIPIIARSAFVEMVVFAVLWFAQNRWEAAFGLLLVGFQLGNTGVMLTALRAVTA